MVSVLQVHRSNHVTSIAESHCKQEFPVATRTEKRPYCRVDVVHLNFRAARSGVRERKSSAHHRRRLEAVNHLSFVEDCTAIHVTDQARLPVSGGCMQLAIGLL